MLVAVSTATFAIIMATSLIGLLGRGSMRGFGIGFAFCCMAYLVLIYFGLANENVGVGRIATTRVLNHVWNAVKVPAASQPQVITGTYVPPTPTPNAGAARPVPIIGTFTPNPSPIYSPDRDHFMQIGQQLWALLIGCLGGVFASWLWRRRSA